jgi:hypothetical protein
MGVLQEISGEMGQIPETSENPNVKYIRKSLCTSNKLAPESE